MRDIEISVERWAFQEPFVITGHVFEHSEVLKVQIAENGALGRGEASGVYYLGENGISMFEQASSVRQALSDGCGREELQSLLPAGGARNAIDCALWDLEAKLSGRTVWALTGIGQKPVFTVNTVGIGTPAAMARKAQSLDTDFIKVKLDAELPLERMQAVRSARPEAQIVVDVNQGWTYSQLVELAPRFLELGVAMIEQPLPRGADEALESYQPPLPLCADESCLHSGELEQAARRYQMINIKLDKTGGLTEALHLAALAKERKLGLMVGNMMGTSLAMAPGLVVAQLCDFVDLDGALFLTRDREHALSYRGGRVSGLAPALWG
ncbi:MAG: N-acetyl-D-Glu racemase DgcA [Haliea sp.]|uniref:N-acetyl-D-Glu racemase DgcA n=1 Tax=Haliea sp. TaxID=1932666 RepID=UPI0032EE40D4